MSEGLSDIRRVERDFRDWRELVVSANLLGIADSKVDLFVPLELVFSAINVRLSESNKKRKIPELKKIDNIVFSVGFRWKKQVFESFLLPNKFRF